MVSRSAGFVRVLKVFVQGLFGAGCVHDVGFVLVFALS